MCADLERKNKQVLILGASAEVNNEMTKILQDQGCVVGSSLDPIEFITNCLILMPRVVFIDVLLKGDVPAREAIKALLCFTRLNGMAVTVFTQFAPEDIGSMQGIEELRQAKNDCIEAGATKYIGRFTPTSFWIRSRTVSSELFVDHLGRPAARAGRAQKGLDALKVLTHPGG